MIAIVILHKRDALAKNGLGNNTVGVIRFLGFDQGLVDLGEIMTIYGCNSPAEFNIFGGKPSQRHNLVGRAINLVMIVVDKIDQVAEVIFTGKHGCLPDLAFLVFTIRGEADGGVLGMTKGQASGKRQTLAERAGRILNPGDIGGNVSLEGGTIGGISFEKIGVEIASSRENGIERGAKMASR